MRMIHTSVRRALAAAAALALSAPSLADYRRAFGELAGELAFVDVPVGERFAMGSCSGGAYLFAERSGKRDRKPVNRLLCLGASVPDALGASHELPQRWVILNRPFQISRHETTVAQFLAFVDAAGRPDLRDAAFERANSDADGAWRARAPVTMVSWDDAADFVAWLNDTRAPKDTGVYRLPTEAEWEYAARAGSASRYGYGDDPRELADYAWYAANARRAGMVGRKAPNAWGLHDMHGNAWEWTRDWYGAYGAPGERLSDDPTGPRDGELRVVRSGSWRGAPAQLRSAARSAADPGMRWDHVGFRVVREPAR